MLKLEQIQKKSADLSGVEPGQVVRIVGTEPASSDSLTVYYKTADGTLRERMLFRTDEANLSLAEVGRPWAFDAPGEEFKLAAEAYRINLAHLFDPMMAVHTSNVEPLPSEAGGDAATTTVPAGGGTPCVEDSAKGGYASGGVTVGQAVKKQFYGSIELDPILAKKQFADLVDEVVQQFTMRPGVKVKIAIEIQAESATGFDDGLQRAVKENCNVLKFKNAEFEPGE
ncbi:hypothetical protein [Tepidimonas aquatica]|uniref:Uncharacterized protein n=1 Tax=Tepidimonas aquatica TaxID=247482 RepID=A0A554WMI7_9BURK|nr:hypothetical protein [Tepidimonas aquatica]TSE24783.1 hypothetical protein Taqua_01348 [Tepidimonas aquatica]